MNESIAKEFQWCQCLICKETFFVRVGIELIVCCKCGNSNCQDFVLEGDEVEEYESDKSGVLASSC